MNNQYSKPRGFGEILDHTFSLSKNKFSDFYLVLLILIGPVYLIQAIIQLLSGTSFFREVGSGDVWYQQVLSSFEEGTATTSNFGANLALALTGFAALLLLPLAQAAILHAVNHIKKGESYTVTSVLKQAFSKFWPIVGSSLLFGLIMFGLLLVPIVLIVIGGVAGVASDMVTGIITVILVFLISAAGFIFLATRWSFYLGTVVMEGKAPGIATSWQLTKKHTWRLIGLYLVFYLIIGAITMAMEGIFSIFLGNSVLFTILINLVSLFTTMILSVGYAVVYFDLKTRQGAGDLQNMIDDYNEGTK